MKTVIEMAEDVGAGIADLPMEDAVLFEVNILSGRSAKLEAFAALVAADEREACAKVCEAGINNATDWDSSYWDQCCENRAAAIRARGSK